MARWVLWGLLAVLALGSGGAALAWACTPVALISVSTTDGPPGSTVTITGRYFVPGGPVEVRWSGQGSPLLAEVTGPDFAAQATIPAAPPGVYYIVATGYDENGDVQGRATRAFEVTAAPAPPPPTGGGDPRPGQGAAPSGDGPPVALFAGCSALSSNVIRATAGASTITGSTGGDRIFGGSGNDAIAGLAGDDCLDLRTGADRGWGGPGNDLIVGRSGEDSLHGGLGRDRLRGGPGSDRIIGGRGNDRALGDQGDDRINGSSGHDRLRGGAGKDRLSGGPGRDRISARDGERDRVSCGNGFDRVVADRIDRVSPDCEQIDVPIKRVVTSSLGRLFGPLVVGLFILRQHGQT